MSRSVSLFLVALAVSLFAVGCTPEKEATDGPTAGADAHDHDHHHHHHDDLGPNEGHLLALADSGFQAEWVHDDETADISVFILDADKKPAKVAYSVSFETTVGETTNSYDLQAVNPDNDGLTSQFTINSGELLTATKMAEQSADAAKATIVATLQNGSFRADIEVHDHDHAH